MRLTQLIAQAGGLHPDAYLERAHIVRLNPDSTRVLIPVSLVGIPPQGAPDSGSRAPVPGSYRPGISPTTVPRRSVSYYIDPAGGFSRRADKNRTFVVELNAAVNTYSARVEPGARIVVPEVPVGVEKTNWGQVLSSVASILTSALTVVLLVQRL